MFSFKSIMQKVGKAMQAEMKLSSDLRDKRRQMTGGPMFPIVDSSSPEVVDKQKMVFLHGRACRIMRAACKAGQPSGRVSLAYNDALHVLNALSLVSPSDSTAREQADGE